jgi:hypothetical protein
MSWNLTEPQLAQKASRANRPSTEGKTLSHAYSLEIRCMDMVTVAVPVNGMDSLFKVDLIILDRVSIAS